MRLSSYKEHLTLILSVFVIHIFLWMHPGGLWDGCIADRLLETHRFAPIKLWFYESQLPIEYWMYRALGFLGELSSVFPYIFFVKLVYLLSLLGIGLGSYEITRASFKLSKLESVIISLFAISLPNYHVLTSSVHIMHLFCIGLFYSFWAFYLKMNAQEAVKGFLFKQILIAAVLMVSFFQSALLVYHYAFVCLLWRAGLGKSQDLKNFLLRHALILVAPFAFYFPKTIWFKAYGLYAGYNSPVIPTTLAEFKVYLYAVAKFLYVPVGNLFYFPLREDLSWSLVYVALTVPVGILFFKIYPKLVRSMSESSFALWKRDAVLAVLCFVSAVFPYIAVGKYPTLGMDWNARQGLLMGYPFGLLVIFGLRGVVGWVRSDSLKKTATVGAFFIFILFLGTLQNSYLYWNVVSKRNFLLQETLKEILPLPCGTYILLRDNAAFKQPWQAQYSMHYILTNGWKDECWLVDSPLSLQPPRMISSREEALEKLNEFWKKKRLYFYETEEERKIYRQYALLENFFPNDQVYEMYLSSSPEKMKHSLFTAIEFLRASKPDPRLLSVEFRPL